MTVSKTRMGQTRYTKFMTLPVNGALGASSTSVLILSVVRLSALISPRTTSVIRRRCQVFWIKSTARLIGSLQMELMMENQHLICLLPGLDR